MESTSIDIKESEAEKLYEDDVFKVIHPMTKAASCFYGKGTQWLTAAARDDNAFDEYNSMGKLYIIINKIKNKKYQFHFEKMRFRNEKDVELDDPGFFSTFEPVLEKIKATDGLIHFFTQIVEQGAEKLYEDEKFRVIHPTTIVARNYYSRGTKWCTTEYTYSVEGDQYIIIDKINIRKYQFHFEVNVFEDEMGKLIKKPFLKTIKATDGLIHFFNQIIEQGAEKLYEDEKFTVRHLTTEMAINHYCRGTKWDRYDYYNERAKWNWYDDNERAKRDGCEEWYIPCYTSYCGEGKQYLVIDKINNRRYQFHFEVNIFEDEMGRLIKEPVLKTIGATDGLIHFCLQKIENITYYNDAHFKEKTEEEPVYQHSSNFSLVTEGCLIISENDGRYGIRKMDEDFDDFWDDHFWDNVGYDDCRDTLEESEIILAEEFDSISRFTLEKCNSGGIFVVCKGENTGLYHYYTDSIQWGYKGNPNKHLDEYKELLRTMLLPSWLDVTPESAKLRIQKDADLTDMYNIFYGCPF